METTGKDVKVRDGARIRYGMINATDRFEFRIYTDVK